uniref:Uncharacterized protein n=1 Tax=Arundo donax TaxID=35708 RepID=A0A0A9HNQ5_ARUDO
MQPKYGAMPFMYGSRVSNPSTTSATFPWASGTRREVIVAPQLAILAVILPLESSRILGSDAIDAGGGEKPALRRLVSIG